MWNIHCPGNYGGECFDHPQWADWRNFVRSHPEEQNKSLQRLSGNIENSLSPVHIMNYRLKDVSLHYLRKYGKPSLNGRILFNREHYQRWIRGHLSS